MNPYLIGGALVLGAVISLGIYVYQNYANQNDDQYQSGSHDNRKRNFEQQHRNLTCPYCTCGVASGDFRLPCGHLCHKSCLYERHDYKRYCRFCTDIDRSDDESAPSSTKENIHNTPSTLSEPVRRRNVNTSDNKSAPSLTKENIHNKPSTSSEPVQNPNHQNFPANSCVWCDVPLKSDNKIAKLDCGHSVHEECWKSYGNIFNCPMCGSKEMDDFTF